MYSYNPIQVIIIKKIFKKLWFSLNNSIHKIIKVINTAKIILKNLIGCWIFNYESNFLADNHISTLYLIYGRGVAKLNTYLDIIK